MAKMECSCGHLFNLSKTPIEGEFSLVPEEAMYDVFESTLGAVQVVERLDESARHVLLCPRCTRLWLQQDVDSNRYILYQRTT